MDLNFEEFFSDRLRERGWDLKKLSEASGIAKKHLEALASGNFKNMPPEPYFRGYLARLGELLNFDAEIWWRKLKEGGFVTSSGGADAMPKNRFLTKKNVKIIWLSVVVIVIALYLVFQLPRILGKPEIAVAFPPGNPATVFAQEITLSGVTKNASELYVNGELVPLGVDGSWSKIVLLQIGLHSFEISARKFLGGETTVIQQIIYEPPAGAIGNGFRLE